MRFPENIHAAIFDVDDTLLDNKAHPKVGSLHEHSRLRAIRHIAEKYSLEVLQGLTEQENYEAFAKAKYHSIDGAVWQVLFEKGIVTTEEVDPTHVLLKEIILLKDELHASTLRQYGRTVLHAIEFVTALAGSYDIADKMAIASSAVRRDINIFLDELTVLRTYFPDERVVSYEDIPYGLGKPHPEPFDRAFATLQLPDTKRSNVIAFEDDPRGVISARKAGLYTCAITTRYRADDPALLAAEPHMIIDRYMDGIEVLKK